MTPAVPARATGSWHWSSWSLTRKLPVLTATIVVLVIATSLALTYDALTRARMEAVHERLRRVTRQLVQTSEQSMRTRQTLYRQAASDSAVLGVLHAAQTKRAVRDDSPVVRAAGAALLRLRTQPDSSLPIELWTTDGTRVVHVGTEVREDSSSRLGPEMRTRGAQLITEVSRGTAGSDSIRYGAFYASGGKVLFWTIVPVVEGGRRVGYIAQQRAYRATEQAARIMKELLGDDASMYLHNTTDEFWSTYQGDPTSAITGIDTMRDDFIGERPGVGPVTVYHARVGGTPWAIALEAPLDAVLAEPRATLRRLMMISLVLALGGVAATWALSRRITAPIESLASLSESIARGDYEIRMPEVSGHGTRDEVARLTASFNRMAGEIEATHRELEQQVEEALSVSQELEETNRQLQQLSADAEEARDAAQAANRAKGDFLAVMSHELRTPLNAIGGYADILQLGIYGDVSEQQRDALRRITRSQQMLLSLINDVLNFAKLDAGQVQYRMKDTSLHDTLSGLEALVSPQLRAKGLGYSFEPCTDLPTVRADGEKLQQIVLNLLSNAIKFTPVDGTILLSCDEDGDAVHVRVRDTGIGIPLDRLDAIFDPFVQVDRALNRPHEGVGLGLSISRDLARGMGGTLSVASALGEGSSFTLTLRRSRRPAHSGEHAAVG